MAVPTFLKWAGGKQQLLKQLDAEFPSEILTYIEPFVGGGSVLFFVLQEYQPAKVVASDSNSELINTYVQVRDSVEDLIIELSRLQKLHYSSAQPKKFYLHCRQEYNRLKSLRRRSRVHAINRAALFIYLNKTCFNGLYRENRAGAFNVPFNGSVKPKIYDSRTLRRASELLQGVDLLVSDFSKLDIPELAVVYFDPPYWVEPGDSGFTSYTQNGFGEAEQRSLASLFRKLDAAGCKLILSNSDTQLIRDLYDDYSFVRKKARRMINCDGNRRGGVMEVIISNKN